MSTWKQVLLAGNEENLATTDLTQADEDRTYTVPAGRQLSINAGASSDSIIVYGSTTGTDRKIEIACATPGNFYVNGGGSSPGTMLLEALLFSEIIFLGLICEVNPVRGSIGC